MSTTELDRRLHASVLKREALKEREYRDKKQQLDEEFKLGVGGTEMSKAELRKVIDSDRRMYYRTEELNDKLYIHYKGWKNIQSLEGWTGLKALYAECNAFDRIQGLQNCRALKSLFLQDNAIRRISGLENCPELWTINLSNNFIERLEGLKHLRKLNTLIITKNRIGFGGIKDVTELRDMHLSTLDIQGNMISDPDIVPEVLSQMPELRVLYLKDNPCAKKIPNYRKSTTVYIKDLKYLDDRPVFPEDRRAAEAFNRGGLEEERAERRRIRQEASDRHDRNMKAFSEMIERARAEKREQTAMRAEDKYTEESDPVDTMEKRMKRQVDKWREENAEDLECEADKYAKKCLAAEKVQEPSTKNEDDSKPKFQPPPRTGRVDSTEKPTEPTLEEEKTSLEQAAECDDKPPKDNRKLVYEDIWDDVPTGGAKPSSCSTSEARPKSCEKVGLTSATQTPFLPWAAGATGMDAVAPSSNAVERRMAELHEQSAGTHDGAQPAWYAKYSEKVREQRADAEGGTPSVSGRVQQLKAPGGAAAKPSDHQPADANSELQEMD